MIIFEQLGIDIGYVLLGSMGAMLIMLILLIVIMVKHKNLRIKYEAFMKGKDAESLENLITTRFKEVDVINEHMFEVDNHLKKIDSFLLNTYNKMALVKYDAFQEMGGKLSFVLVLLTEAKDGFIINTMHSSREGCYTYVKKIVKGQCDAPLSEEERQALNEAMAN